MTIHMENVTKVYGTSHDKVYALNHVNVTVAQGDWLSILGPSGSGKTTLLNSIGGMDKPDSGTLQNNGQDLMSMGEKALQQYRRSSIGYIFQDFRLLDQYSVLDNVMLPEVPYQPMEKIKQRAESVLEELGMSHRLTHLPGALSGGEKQRAAIARALLNRPSTLLCDEPTGNLDKDNRKRIINILQTLHDQGHTIILVTHDPEVAEAGNRFCHLRDGVLEESVIL